MQVDRTRFLLLTTALASGHLACTPGESAPPSVAISNDPPDSGAAPTAEGAPRPAPTTEARPSATAEGFMAGHPASEGRVSPVTESVTPPPIASGAPLPTCPDSDNMTGAPGNCSTLRAPGPVCESFSDTKADCSKFARGFKPKIAQKAVGCLLAKSGTKAICDFTAEQQCAAEGVAIACVDPSVLSTCDAIISKCQRRSGGGMLTRTTCAQALSAVTSVNRSSVATCVAESCNISYCFYDLH